jgi:hypothetical protein
MKKYVICDIDGTIADLTHRRKFVDGSLGKKDWKSFHAAMDQDTPHYDIIELLEAFIFKETYTPIFVTGRYENKREVTQQWLTRHIYLPGRWNLFMRPDDDFRQDDVVKEEIYERHLIPEGVNPHSTLFVLDDRDRVVNMWRRNGFRVLQVAPGNF